MIAHENPKVKRFLLRHWLCENYKVLVESPLLSDKSKEDLHFYHREGIVGERRTHFLIGFILILVSCICLCLLFNSDLDKINPTLNFILKILLIVPNCLGCVQIAKSLIISDVEKSGDFNEYSGGITRIPIEFIDELHTEYTTALQTADFNRNSNETDD